MSEKPKSLADEVVGQIDAMLECAAGYPNSRIKRSVPWWLDSSVAAAKEAISSRLTAIESELNDLRKLKGGFVRKCLLIPQSVEEGTTPMFVAIGSDVIPTLDSYAIVPREHYEDMCQKLGIPFECHPAWTGTLDHAHVDPETVAEWNRLDQPPTPYDEKP